MRTIRPVLAAVVIAFTVAGCSGGASDSGSARSFESAPGAGSATEAQKAPGDSSTPIAERKEIVTGTIYLTTDDPIDASHRASARVTVLGGRIDSRNESPETPSNRAHSQVVVRVPADKTDQFINELGDYGTVTTVDVSSSDVTMQHQDLSARAAALQTSVDRLQEMLRTAGSTSDLIQIETTLSQRQADLDSLNSQLRGLNDQIDLSTLTLSFSTEKQTAPDEPDTFWSGLTKGWDSLTSALHSAWVAFGVMLPWLGLLAIIGTGGFYALRALVHRIDRKSKQRVPNVPSQVRQPDASNSADQAQ